MVFMTIWHETIYFIISQNNNLGVKYASFDFLNAMMVSKLALFSLRKILFILG